MDSFVLDAQASEMRTELIKERKKRFELEAKLRTLEQRLGQTSLTSSTDHFDSTRRLETVASDAALSPAISIHAGPVHELATSRPRSSSEILEKRRKRDQSPSPRGEFNLEAERDWFTSLRLPESSNLGSSGYSINKSNGSLEFPHSTPGSTDGGAADDEERRSGIETPEENDPSLGPSLANNNALRSRFSSTAHGLGDSSPTLSGFAESRAAMQSYGSAWSTADSTAYNTATANSLAASTNVSGGNRRRFDESAVRVSQLKIELSEYKQVLADTGALLKTFKGRSEYLESELSDAELANNLLRAQVREKNTQIIALQAGQGSVETLKQLLDSATKEKIALQVELGVSRRANAATAESEETFKAQCQLLQAALATKDKAIESKEEMLKKLADKCMQLKLELQAIVPHLCKFSVSTITRLMSKPVIVSIGVLKPQGGAGAAQLSASSSHHSRELEIVISGKRVTHPASFVVSIAASATYTDRFSVTYRNGNTDTFESSRRAEVISTLNSNLFDTSPHDLDIPTA